MTFRSVILCATPRSGSTLLCDLLAATGVAGRPRSFFRRQSIPGLARTFGLAEAVGEAAFEPAYLAAVVRAGTDRSGVFGLRLMQENLDDLAAMLGRLFPEAETEPARFEAAFGKPLSIHLWRVDTVAQAVSRLRAEQSGLWHRDADGGERERTAPAAPCVYDADRLAAHVDELSRQAAAWSRWFAAQGIEPLRLSYEALAADPRGELAKVMSALGHDPAIAAKAEVRTARLADAESREWADRFRRERGLADR